jgi:DNA invertase Pin-like site-specific DNA recombinase
MLWYGRTHNRTEDGMKAIGYIRVSTSQQADTGVSMDAQRQKIEQYAELYDLDLVDIVADAGASGKTLDRDGLQEALNRMEQGEADTLVVVKLDRLTRSVADLNALLEGYFTGGLDLVSVSEQINTGTASGRLVLNVLMSVSQWEREAIGERTSAALQHKKAQGERVGSIPYGYRLSADGVHLEEHEAEQQMIAAVLSYREAGLSYRRIAERLKSDGYTNRKGRTFNPRAIGSILKANAA